MKKLLVLIAIALTGCATSKPVYLADGSQGHKVSCDGTVLNFGSCLEKAGEICGAMGYTLLDKDGSAAPLGVANVNQYGGFAQYGMMITRYIMVKCKDAG